MHIVHDNCEIGRNTTIHPFASVIRGARIGDNCSVGSCAVVDGSLIGDNCSIGHGAQVHPGVSIGCEVFVGPGAIFCNDAWPRVNKEGFDLEEVKRRTTIIVHDGASIGAGAIILPGVSIGQGAMIAAGAVVSRDVPAFYRLNGDLKTIYQCDKTRMKLLCE